jgi:protoporphyrinogen oxidase
MIAILGGGPSGLMCANYLKEQKHPFVLLSTGGNGFSEESANGLKFKSGQRTLFAHKDMDEFIKTKAYRTKKVSLSELTSVCYKGSFYKYPVQNNLPFKEKFKAWLSYIVRDRKKASSDNFADWAVGNYGKYISNNVILPHTWKTIKEDLLEIQSSSFGQKVVPMKLFNKDSSNIMEYENASLLLKELEKNVAKNMENAKVLSIDPKHKTIELRNMDNDDPHQNIHRITYDKVINTIALPKLMRMVKGAKDEDIIDVATRSLHYNNMFLAVMIVPTKFIKLPYKIVYFPERDYLFSKVNITKGEGYSVISSEVSFRKNDESLLQSQAYCNKILERVEYDLKKAGVIAERMFATFETRHKVISPAYIICDSDYDMYNSILQTWLNQKGIFNIGRFAEWVPHKRVEHSLAKVKEFCDGL